MRASCLDFSSDSNGMFAVIFSLVLISLTNGLPFGLGFGTPNVQVVTYSPNGQQLQVGPNNPAWLMGGLRKPAQNGTTESPDQGRPVRRFWRSIFSRFQRQPEIINLSQFGRDLEDDILALEEPAILLLHPEQIQAVLIRNIEMELPIYEDQLRSF